MYEFGWPLSNQGFIIRLGMCRLIGIGDDFGTIMIKLVDDVEDRRL